MRTVTAWWTDFAASAYARTLGGLAAAFVLGTLIGLEWQWRQRTAGLLTNVLVAAGAAASSDLNKGFLDGINPTQEPLVTFLVHGGLCSSFGG